MSARPALHRPDRIALTGVTAIGRHGVFERERRDGQPFIVDAVLYTDIRAAAEADDLLLTANYGDAADLIAALITGPAFDLIEALAERIAAQILLKFPVSAVEVTVHKPKAPIQVPFGDVAVSIYREKQ
ncbi:dihydroneopterin aldolase [Arthrobacter sp. H14-L1]|uniref:dihydroneopterin aldolase n=1 Tax=Arthrobacter sp. H14-L1 TaxID=2996697 RepID=UPI00226FBE50|nr:dihydroneopterin aldolase [Arthrobacter sp. H14-L1]MCY0904167.1 dihydroneopterin aldolase [Arthrobacter sp. H14-L1]